MVALQGADAYLKITRGFALRALRGERAVGVGKNSVRRVFNMTMVVAATSFVCGGAVS
jgi:hypothetical protein